MPTKDKEKQQDEVRVKESNNGDGRGRLSVTVKREQFLTALQCVRCALTPKDIIEQSSSFIFQRGFVHSFNEELACRARSGLGKEFSGAVQGKPLLDVLEDMTDEDVTISLGDGELLINGRRRRGGIVMDHEILLRLDQIEEPGEWKPLPEDLCEALKLVASCTNANHPKFWLTCVHIHPQYVEACDNKQLIRHKMKLQDSIKNDFLIRGAAAKAVSDLGMNEVSESGSWIHFRNPNKVVLSSRRWNEQFRDLAPILEIKDGRPISLPKGMSDAAKAAEKFATETGTTGNPKLVVTLKNRKEAKGNNLIVRGEGALGWLEEPFGVDAYDGPTFRFTISPTMLSEIANKYNDCLITDNRLKVDSGKFQYVAVLGKPEDKGRGKEVEEDGPPDAKEEENDGEE